MTKHPRHIHDGPPDYEHAKPGSAAWFFEEFWPVLIFGSLFILMMALPVALSPLFSKVDYYSQGAEVWSAYGLLIIAAFVAALLIMFLKPRFVSWFVGVLGFFALVASEEWAAWHWGSDIAVLFLFFMIFGDIFMVNVTKRRYPIEREQK